MRYYNKEEGGIKSKAKSDIPLLEQVIHIFLISEPSQRFCFTLSTVDTNHPLTKTYNTYLEKIAHVLDAPEALPLDGDVLHDFIYVWNVVHREEKIEVRRQKEGIHQFVELGVAVGIASPHHRRPQNVEY